MELSAASAPCPTSSEASRRSRPAIRPCGIDAPLAGLAGSDLSRRFRHWRGAGGRRYLFSVFPLDRPDAVDDMPRFADAVVLAVHRHGEQRRILALDETGGLPDLFYFSTGFREAVAAGANEIHVHLLTEDPTARAAMLRDLAAA